MVAKTGNTILPPPRQTGDAATDAQALQRWFASFYDSFVKSQNIIGNLADLEARVTALEAKNPH